jgi:hypothetical protein
MKAQNDLFEEGDPLDDPRWKAAKTTSQVSDFVGCPMAWLEQVLPHVQGECQLTVVLLLYRRWVLCGRPRTFDFPNGDLKRLGIKRSVKSRALAKLKEAGLITIGQLGGHAVRITRCWQ